MFAFFNNNQISTGFLLLLYIGIFFLPQFNSFQALDPTILAQQSGLLSRWFYERVGQEGLLPQLVYLVLFIAQVFLVNALVNHFRLAKRYTYITGLCFVLISNLFVGGSGLSPFFLGNFFALFALWSLYSVGDKKASMGDVYNIGLGVGLACLCASPFLAWLPIAWLGLLQMRSFDWREHLIFLSGFFTCFLLAGTWLYIQDGFNAWLQADFVAQFGLPQWQITLSPWWYASLVCLLILALWSLANIGNLTTKTSLKEQKSIMIIFTVLIFSSLSFFTTSSIQPNHFSLFALPLGILLSLNIHAMRHPASVEVVHLVLLLYALSVQFFS